MNNKDDIIQENKNAEEELLDFDFDEFSEEDIQEISGGSPSDEEIIELVDIVEKGEMIEDSDLALDGSDESPEEDASQSLEADLDSVLAGLESPEVDIAEEGSKEEASESDELAELLGEDEDVEGDLDFALDDLEESLEEDVPQSAELGLDSVLAGLESPEVDIAEEGGKEEASESDELAELLDEEEVIEEGLEVKEESDLALDELDKGLEEEAPAGLETDLDSMLEGLESSEKADSEFDFLGTDLESAPEAESLEDTEFDSEVSAEPEATEGEVKGPSPDVAPDAPLEDLSKVQPAAEEPINEELIGISEDRIEVIITRVVQDVVERVARETMATVAERVARETTATIAEKVITEAIDALKQSLESSQN